MQKRKKSILRKKSVLQQEGIARLKDLDKKDLKLLNEHLEKQLLKQELGL